MTLREPHLRVIVNPLEPIGIEEYVEAVLPQTAPLWQGTRSFERYVADLRDYAASAYGRRRFRLFGLRTDGRIVASCKRYERDLRCGERTLKAVGIGAVYTSDAYRRRGLATALLASLLDAERERGTDLAYLFSDIHPRFYEQLGFLVLPSRSFSVRAASLEGARIAARPIDTEDWPAVARCFEAMETLRPVALKRTPVVWERIRARYAVTQGEGQIVTLAIHDGRRIAAYCLGRRIVRSDAYVVDEFGFAGDAARALIGPLLRAAAGDLARISGWLPPEAARRTLPRGSVRVRAGAIAMMAPLSRECRARAANGIDGDPVWSTDHI